MRLRKQTALLLALVAGLAAGCGADEEGKPIPAATATDLNGQLNSIQGRLDVPGACGDITGGDDPNTTVVQRQIDSLPDDVDADVRDALQQSFDHLFDLVDQECAQEQPTTETDTTETEPPPDTETTETTDTTETAPPDTLPTDTIPTETLPPTDTEPVPPTDDGGFGPEEGL